MFFFLGTVADRQIGKAMESVTKNSSINVANLATCIKKLLKLSSFSTYCYGLNGIKYSSQNSGWELVVCVSVGKTLAAQHEDLSLGPQGSHEKPGMLWSVPPTGKGEAEMRSPRLTGQPVIIQIIPGNCHVLSVTAEN